MATIKEVAKKADVSIGTVSNVINGKKVKDELRIAVQEAISELNYTPHALARSLKNNKTNTIALVLPNLIDSYLIEYVKNTERILRESGLNISLYITNKNAEEENKMLDSVMERRFDGIVLYSCQRAGARKIEELIKTGLPVVFLENEVIKGDNVSFVAFDNRAAVREALIYLIGLGHNNIALLSSENSFSDQTLIQGYRRALEKCGMPVNEELIRITEAAKENAFKEMISLLQMDVPPTAVILSNKTMADGLYEAAHFNRLSVPEDISVITLSEQTWLKHGKLLHTSIERPMERISRIISDLLISNIRNPRMYEASKHYIESVLTVRSTCTAVKIPEVKSNIRLSAKKINVLLLDSPAAHAVKMLLPDFKDKYDIDIEIELMGFKELYSTTESELSNKSSYFDVFMVDVSRIQAMCETGSIADITDKISTDSNFSSDRFIEGLFDSYCFYKGRVYGLPFMPGTQILFYRKDLFTSRAIGAAYYRRFEAELRPPRTWQEFNKIAGFFTEDINPGSPVPYGITMAARLPVFVTNEFCPRKWAYGARAFDESGIVAINSSEALNALHNFIESYRYAPAWAFENDWNGEINDFCSGQCAMVIQYESHSTRIGTRMRKDLKNSIGYDEVPGGNPLLGGWSLVVNRHGRNSSRALDFLRWACGHEMAVPYSILGGTTAWKSYYKSAELGVLYPWLDVAYRSYKMARKRSSPYRGGPTIIKQGEYEEIMGEEIRRAVVSEISPEDCLHNIEKRLAELIG